MELLALTYCVAGCNDRGHKDLSASKVFVDDIKVFVNGTDKELVEVAEKVLKKLKMEVGKKGMKLWITEGGKGVALETGVETLGSASVNENHAAGSEGIDEKEEVWCEMVVHQENRIFQKEYMRTGVRKLLRTGSVPARAWRGQAVGIPSTC